MVRKFKVVKRVGCDGLWWLRVGREGLWLVVMVDWEGLGWFRVGWDVCGWLGWFRWVKGRLRWFMVDWDGLGWLRVGWWEGLCLVWMV